MTAAKSEDQTRDSLRLEIETLTDFLCSNKIEVMNVAGPRESKEPGRAFMSAARCVALLSYSSGLCSGIHRNGYGVDTAAMQIGGEEKVGMAPETDFLLVLKRGHDLPGQTTDGSRTPGRWPEISLRE